MMQKSYRDEVAIRLNQLFDLVKVRHSDLHIATMCKLLGIDDVYEFEKYTFIIPDDIDTKSVKRCTKKKFGFNLNILNLGSSSEDEIGHTTVKNKHYNPEDLIRAPKLQLLQDLADIFGVNPEWLQKGQGAPFKYRYSTNDLDIRPLYPEECLLYINVFPALKYYFVLSEELDIAIVLQISEYKFIVVTKSWTLNANSVGRTGQKQMESLCYLLERLSLNQTRSKLVSQKFFNSLMSGQVYPGIVEYMNYSAPDLGYEMKSSYWQDDLPDNRNGVQELYQSWFKEAQECIAFVRNAGLAGGRRYEIPESNSIVIPKVLITENSSADTRVPPVACANGQNERSA